MLNVVAVVDQLGSLLLLERRQLWRICDKLAQPWLLGADPEHVCMAAGGIFRLTRTFDRDLTAGRLSFLLEGHEKICRLLRQSLQQGTVELKRDAPQLVAFRAWLEESHIEPEAVPGLLNILNSQAPSEIWR